ncbi:hypothetical protein VKT23_003641, partial [Stygiomarasmius scandens]
IKGSGRAHPKNTGTLSNKAIDNSAKLSSRSIQQSCRSTSAVFPFSTISDKEVMLLSVPSYRSHRLVIEKGGEMMAVTSKKSPALMVPIYTCPRRLIHTHTLRLVEFAECDVVPPYAILSHRWMKGKEVNYDEFLHPHNREKTFSKLGYHKIRSACKQARLDGIHYIWIDTCCIQQGNHADVAVNITSMYAYYQNSEVCYAYLGDLSKDASSGYISPRGYAELTSSDWFGRGWTLQELLAPQTVIFFNKYWQYIGDKHESRNQIHQKTGIPLDVLSGERTIQDIDMLVRMSWATQRRTTKEQDKAYCLQGLLGISVEPDYNETWQTSFNRLGKALFDAHPGLKKEWGMDEDKLNHGFIDLYSSPIYELLVDTHFSTLPKYKHMRSLEEFMYTKSRQGAWSSPVKYW